MSSINPETCSFSGNGKTDVHSKERRCHNENFGPPPQTNQSSVIEQVPCHLPKFGRFNLSSLYGSKLPVTLQRRESQRLTDPSSDALTIRELL